MKRRSDKEIQAKINAFADDHDCDIGMALGQNGKPTAWHIERNRHPDLWLPATLTIDAVLDTIPALLDAYASGRDFGK